LMRAGRLEIAVPVAPEQMSNHTGAARQSFDRSRRTQFWPLDLQSKTRPPVGALDPPVHLATFGHARCLRAQVIQLPPPRRGRSSNSSWTSLVFAPRVGCISAADPKQ